MNLPEAFVINTKKLLGKEYQEFEKALEENPPTSIRVNNKNYFRNESSKSIIIGN